MEAAPPREILGASPPGFKKKYGRLPLLEGMKEKKRMGNFLVWDLMTPSFLPPRCQKCETSEKI